MASNSWIAETVGDFIHSSIWRAPIHTFIEENCATFDYDDDEEESHADGGEEEQRQIYRKYQRLVESLIAGLGHDLSLDAEELKRVCEPSDNSSMIDESYEQLYSARDFQLFQEMMRRKNLILQLQALVSLQLQWGLLKHTDTGDDLVLSLLLQATKSPSRRASIEPSSPPPPVERKAPQPVDDDDDDEDVVMSKPPAKEPIRLPGLRQKGAADVDWYRDLPARSNSPAPLSISEIPQSTLREKLRELTDRTSSATEGGGPTSSAIQSRKDFLQQQRELLLRKQRAERNEDLEQQTRNARPQSAAHAARKAMTNSTPPPPATKRERRRRSPKVNWPNVERWSTSSNAPWWTNSRDEHFLAQTFLSLQSRATLEKLLKDDEQHGTGEKSQTDEQNGGERRTLAGVAVTDVEQKMIEKVDRTRRRNSGRVRRKTTRIADEERQAEPKAEKENSREHQQKSRENEQSSTNSQTIEQITQIAEAQRQKEQMTKSQTHNERPTAGVAKGDQRQNERQRSEKNLTNEHHASVGNGSVHSLLLEEHR